MGINEYFEESFNNEIHNSRRLIIAAGGTGGHIYPALAVAQALAAKDVEILWIGVRHRMEERIVPSYFPIKYIDVRPLRGRSFKEMLVNPFYFLKSVRQAKKIIKQFKAKAVLTMGGFVCGPVGLAAKQLKLPLIIHEQNAIAGWTNELLARWASKVLEAYPKSFKGKGKLKALCVGNPLRAEIIAESENKVYNPGSPLKILVLGGSQGARYLNTLVAESLVPFVQSQAIEVLHQSGSGQEELVKKSYGQSSELVEIVPFLQNIEQVYAWCDLVISRSGALSLGEIAMMGRPSILVPFPGAVGDHQRYNAKFVVEQGGAILLEQEKARHEDWERVMQALLNDSQQLITMSQQVKQLAPKDTTRKVVEICEEYL